MLSIFLICALICFLLATFNVPAPINLTALGLAFCVISQVVPMFAR